MPDSLDTIRRIYDSFGRGDVPAIVACMAEDVAWESWADNAAQRAGVPWLQARGGRAGVAEFFQFLGTKLEVRSFEILNVMAADRSVAVEFVIEALVRDTGRVYRDEEIHLWTLNEAGRVTRLRHYTDTAKHIRAAGLDTGVTPAGERRIIRAIHGEYLRYKKLAEQAFTQLTDAQLAHSLGDGDLSIATIAWHVAGNLASRFTDFLDSDGEKPWRDREAEFAPRRVPSAELLAHWETGWRPLLETLERLADADLDRTIRIRRQPLSVVEALQRSLAHTSHHVGQIMFVAKHLRAADWEHLSIPPGRSADYNKNPTLEKPPAR